MTGATALQEGQGAGTSDDVSGIPSAQLKILVEEHLDTDLANLARRVGIDYRYLRRLVLTPTTPVVKLGLADKILMALDLNLTLLADEGLITIVPLRGSRTAAQKIVDDEIWLAEDTGLPMPTEEEVETRIANLMAAYGEYCQPTPEQITLRAKDYARKKNSQ